jgi:Domain of unknown function (DUF4388)
MTMLPSMIAFHGDLSVFKVLDVIQLVYSSRKTGRLRIISQLGREIGEVVFNAGRIAAARSTNSSDEPAVQQLLEVERGRFDFLPSPVPFHARIQVSTPNLLMRCLQKLDEKGVMFTSQPA